jgi:hypothetical protein
LRTVKMMDLRTRAYKCFSLLPKRFNRAATQTNNVKT